MAVDSEAKRASALYFIRHRKGRLIADGTISGVDFLDIVGFYRGIAAAIPVGLYSVSLLSAVVSQPAIAAAAKTFATNELNPSGKYFTVSTTTTITQPAITITEKNDIS